MEFIGCDVAETKAIGHSVALRNAAALKERLASIAKPYDLIKRNKGLRKKPQPLDISGAEGQI